MVFTKSLNVKVVEGDLVDYSEYPMKGQNVLCIQAFFIIWRTCLMFLGIMTLFYRFFLFLAKH